MPNIVIVGASKDRSKFGNKAVRIYASQGYKVYPIHPKEESIEGHKVYKSVSEVPEKKLDRVSFYVPPPVGMKVVEDLATKQVGELWLNPGADSPELVAKAEKLGLSVISACSIVNVGITPEKYD